MKILLNWRYYAMTALMAAGLSLLFAAFGDFTVPMGPGREILCRLILITAALAVLYTLHRITCHWERGGKIPEFTNQKYN